MPDDNQYTLLKNQTADAAAGVAKQNSALTDVYWTGKNTEGGGCLLVVGGTFAGATVKLECKPGTDLDAYVEDTNLTFDEPTIRVLNLPARLTISASVAGATGSTDVSMVVQKS